MKIRFTILEKQIDLRKILSLGGITFFFLLLSISSNAQITGTVFRDFNGNGLQDDNEPNIEGVLVKAFDATGEECGNTLTTDELMGTNYELTGCGDAVVRVEFTIPQEYCISNGLDFSGFSGDAYGSAVQFTTGNASDINFAIQNPGDYNQGAENTFVFTGRHTNGDPLAGGTSSSEDWFVGYPYTHTGTMDPTYSVDGSIIGPVWGAVYSKQAGKIFTSALMKRHTGFGVLGSGGIYLLEPDGNTFLVESFYDMDANGHRTRAGDDAPEYGEGSSYELVGSPSSTVNYLGADDPLTGLPSGFGVIGTNVERGILADKAEPNHDPAAFDQVGKVGLGSMQISEDGKFLFVVNLYSRLLFRLELDDATNPTEVINVTSYTLPSTDCNNGVLRPFGLKYHRDKLYLGAVCSGENGGENIVDGNTDLEAFVFQFINPTEDAQFVSDPLITFPLNYRKGKARTGFPENDQWYPWTNDSDTLNATSNATPPSRGSYAQPVLSDIDFTDRGDLIMAFMDRGGHQWGHQNKRFLGNSEQLVRYQLGGDILIAGKNCETGSFTLENNGTFNSTGQEFTSDGEDNNEGPGGGEFFFKELSEEIHQETHMGSIATLPGQDQVFNTVMNPLIVFSGGTVLYSTSTGLNSNEYQIYSSENLTAGTLGKANGLGDISFSLEAPPIEVGNYVWLDSNGDGIQTADESGIDEITVELFKENELVGTTQTSNGGQYYFNDSNVILGGESGLKPLMDYEIRIPLNQTPIDTLNLTLSNVPPIGGSLDDHSDNDGVPGPGYVFIQITTGIEGANNHTYDFGFQNNCPDPIDIELATQDVSNCDESDGSITISGLESETIYTVSYYFNGNEVGPLDLEANTDGEIILDNLAAGIYTLVSVNLEDCTTTDFTELEILDPETPVFEVNGIDPVDCIGGNGIINISGLDPNEFYEVAYNFEGNPQGPFNLQTNDDGIIVLIDLEIGSYTNFIVTSNDCVGESQTIIDLEFPESPTFTIDSSDPTVCEDANGTITILDLEPEVIYEVNYKLNGLDQGPFDLESDMAGTILLSNLSAGIYTEISVSLNSCETIFPGQVLLVEPEGPDFDVSSTDPTVCEDSNGTITISGLLPQLEYEVSYNYNTNPIGPIVEIADGDGNIIIENLGAGSYTEISVSLDGCESINDEILELVEPEGPDFEISSGSPTDCEAEDGFILISGLLNFVEYEVSYRLDNMLMGPFSLFSDELGEIMIDNLGEGMYSDVTVSLDGCETSLDEMILLNEPEGPTFTLAFENPINCIESDGVIIVSDLEAETEYFISYNVNGSPFGPQAFMSDINGEILLENLEPGNYNSISVALLNCETTSMEAIILDEPEAPEVDAGDFQQICIGTEVVIEANNPDGAIISWDGGIIDGQAFVLEVGNYIFTVTATLNGCEAMDQVSLSVIPDIVTLDCQNVFYNLSSGLCGATIALNVNPVDGCVPGGADDYTVQYVSGVQSGDFLEVGEYTSTWQLLDPEGIVVDECTINVIIVPFEGDNVTLVCNDLVNISIGEGCIAEINADMILEGSGYNCYDEYIVTIAYPQIPGINIYPNADYPGANIIDHTHVGLTLVVYITDPITGNTCWGRITIEDKFPPILECENLQFPCTDDYVENRDPRGNQIVFPSDLFWPRDFRSTTSDLSIAINQRKFTVLANIIDCTEVTLTYSDSVINGDCEDPDGIFKTVIRTWVAKDAYGNISSCEQIITFTILTIDELLAELDLEPMIMVACDETIPEIVTGPVTCNIWFGLNNELKLPLCGDGDYSYKLFRTYTIFDDCTGEMRDFTQIIVVKDEIPPVIVDCNNGQLPTRRVAAQSFGCNAEVILVAPLVVDNCSDLITVVPSIPNVQLTFIDGSWRAWLGLGTTYSVLWTAYDECGNSSTCIENIIVEDKNPPVAVCIEYTKVSLTAQIQQDGTYEEAFARVFANSFDNGSYDNCEIFDFKVMRMSNTTITVCGQTHNTSENPPLGSVFNPLSPNGPFWRDYIDLCCEDLASDDPIMVVLRVRDIYGNVNYCMVNVEVESKIPPVLTGPDDVVIDCRDVESIEELIEVLSDRELSLANGFGWADLSSLCEEELRVNVTANLTACGITDLQNRVRRTFSAGTGANTRTVTQEIFVINETPFRILNVQPGGVHNRIDDIVWPIDLDLPSCDEAYDFQSLKERYNEIESIFSDFAELGESSRPRSMPFLRPVACSIPGVGYDDWEFELEGGCIKIIRQWKIIDWCQIDPETGTYRQWMYEQVIRVLDSAPAVFEEVTVSLTNAGIVDDESVTVGCPTGLITVAHSSENCTPVLSFALEASDDCSKLQNITYTYQLTVGSGANSFVPTATVVSGDGNVNALGEFGFNFGNFGAEFQNVVHRIRWTLDDRCGNISICEFEFTVRDDKKPSPICTDEIIAVLMPSAGMISLSASIFDVASFDNCAGDLKYTFNAPFGEAGALEVRVFDCNDYSDNYNAETLESIITLPVFVTDASGNFDICTVRVQLQDNDGVCNDTGSIVIRGHIESAQGEILGGSDELTINGFKLYFNSDSKYSLRIPEMTLENLPYDISPARNDNPMNGVTTLDIVLIQRHILGQTRIENPYERIAADVNGDGKINALDIMELRQLILLKRTNFTGNNSGLSWKFVDKDYQFTTAFPEGEAYARFINISNEQRLDDNDFVAVKIGDINTNASFDLGVTEDRSVAGKENITIRNNKLMRGEIASIQLNLEATRYLDGYQLSILLTDNLEILEVENQDLGMSEYNFGIFREEGLVTASWHGNSNRVDNLLTIKVRALEDLELKNAIRLSESPKNPVSECYNGDLETRKIALKFVSDKNNIVQGYDLLQNEPNPFRNDTKINFLLPIQEKVKIEVTSGSGQVVKVIEGVYPGGWNSIFLSASDLGNAGIFFYTISTENYQSVKKMIVIR